ncbi:aminotransferase class I/II-fold pyridoxal phosphate-dependent enzyme [Novilysobacter antarcticus]|uniref:aminotransferase class I/II-fold pyridoxal phosphate-dependent enzyme n=1 Tax=Novilysobacter antarcticus TaxID=2862543 RepID=UPI001C995C48|nr:8-amino-7-oxononanoate synthase [Lysobacter antarcticus]
MARAFWGERIEAIRAQRADAPRSHARCAISHRDGARCTVDGRELLNFCSEDYLGLSQHYAVIGALQDAVAVDGAGGSGSHLACGRHRSHERLEEEIADWLGTPRVLLFGSRYLANLAVLQSLLGDEDVCAQDGLNHGSLVDAARLAGCRLRRYPHGDPEGAIRQLRGMPDGMAMVATEGVFGTDGDVAPLRQLALVARVQHALLYVDDAHGIGVVGPEGRGSIAAANLGVDQVPLQLASLGKALGGQGAAVAGTHELIEHLTETARPYLFTTALPPAQAAAGLTALKLARKEQWRREKLVELVGHFRERAHRAGLSLLDSQTPIQPLLVGDDACAVSMAAALQRSGYWVEVAAAPTLGEGQARLRVTLSALHAPADIDGLIDAMSGARDRARAEARVAAISRGATP